MTCEEFVELISVYLDAVLEAEQEALFVEHLRRCPPCAVCLEQFRQTATILAAVPAPATIAVARREHLLAAFRAAHG